MSKLMDVFAVVVIVLNLSLKLPLTDVQQAGAVLDQDQTGTGFYFIQDLLH